jgi:hypothetical protein
MLNHCLARGFKWNLEQGCFLSSMYPTGKDTRPTHRKLRKVKYER